MGSVRFQPERVDEPNGARGNPHVESLCRVVSTLDATCQCGIIVRRANLSCRELGIQGLKEKKVHNGLLKMSRNLLSRPLHHNYNRFNAPMLMDTLALVEFYAGSVLKIIDNGRCSDGRGFWSPVLLQ